MKHNIIAVFLSLILAGCSGVMTPPENGNDPQNGAGGNLTVRIGYAFSAGRTAYPTHNDDGSVGLDYALEFAYTGSANPAPAHDPVSVSPGIPVSLRLETGSWTITAKAMAEGVEKASGSAAVTITESGNADVAVTLSPVDGAPAVGTLGYTLYFPAGATGSLNLAEASGNPAGSDTAFVSGTGETITDLNPGSYLVTVSLTGGGETAGRTEAIHIVAGLTTKVAYNFYEDLAAAPTPVTGDTDLAKIGVDPGWPLSGRYVLAGDITLNDWVPLGSKATPFTGSFDGGGHTITVNSFDATALANEQYVGIFAAVQGIPENKARVKNLNIASSVSITAPSTTIGQGIGLLTGYAEDAVLSGIELSGSLSITGVATATFAGGVVGDMRKGAELRDCDSAMSLSVASGVSYSDDLSGPPPYTEAEAKTTAIGGLVGFFLTSADGSEYGEGKDVLIKNCVNSGALEVNWLPTGSIYGYTGVGGIAGGWQAPSAAYLGRIEDCVYTGTMSFTGISHSAGGIAGAIGGNGGDAGNGANTSRILRCRTMGIISNSGGSVTAAGGIAGIATAGALVEQCSSNAAISGPTGTSGRPGGIVGFLQGARISDCWSAGTVQGERIAGGIAGGNDLNGGTIERCYSRSALSVTVITSGGVGGIFGKVQNAGTVTVSLCVALNDGITAPSTALQIVNRIAGGLITGSATGIAMNYAPEFPMTAQWRYVEVKDGRILEDDPPEQWLYEGTLGWDFDQVWVMGDGFPRLKGVDN
jgi:hypothetical protein